MAVLDYVPAEVPKMGEIVSIMLQVSTFGVLSVCIMRRTQFIQTWAKLPLAMWLILIIYCDSALFVFATAIVVHGFGINSSPQVCEGGILLCLLCYMTTKILIYYFLVEKAYVVRGSTKPRLKTRLWLFNCFGMLLPYSVFAIMNFIYRITYINDNGVCIIGMQKIAMMPLIIFEVIVNVYLTALFILPLRQLYSYKHNANPTLHRIALRSLVGSLATLTTSVANLTVMMVLQGEPGWICFMVCNADILFCVLMLHWVTSKDKMTTSTTGKSMVEELGEGARSTERSSRIEKPVDVVSTVKSCDDRNPSLRLFPVTATQQTGVTTECRSGSPTGRLRAPSRLHRTPTEEFGEDVELHTIVVQTIHTQEVEIDHDRTDSVRSEGSEWVGVERKVVGEGIV